MATSPAKAAQPAPRLPRRYHRSAFNGSRQLSAMQAPTRRILGFIGLLMLALAASLGFIVVSLPN